MQRRILLAGATLLVAAAGAVVVTLHGAAPDTPAEPVALPVLFMAAIPA
jgi:hypothetical protein